MEALSRSAPAAGLAEPLTITVAEAAKLLAIGRTVCYRMVARGELPSVKIGPKLVRIPLAELRQWIADNANGAA